MPWKFRPEMEIRRWLINLDRVRWTLEIGFFMAIVDDKKLTDCEQKDKYQTPFYCIPSSYWLISMT